MRFKSMLKRRLIRTLAYGMFWGIAGLVYVLLEKGLLGKLTTYPATGNPYMFLPSLLLVPPIAFFAGILCGALDIFILKNWLRKISLIYSIIIKTAIYLSFIIIVLAITSIIVISFTQNISILSETTLYEASLFLLNPVFWSLVTYTMFILVMSLFLSEISEYFGYATFSNFIIGKYHSPQRETRIFMFLDMKASTTIAENIGHVQYFKLLKKYYSDMSAPIIETEGKIYQYVGDEIVISWILKSGLKNNNCLNCFFGIRKIIQQKKEEYIELYGVNPEFKAGMHVGEVTTGEIGKVKKDIISTGDILNTTARIQEKCKTYKTDLLISKQLLDLLPHKEIYKIEEMGEFLLKGKNRKIFLNAVSHI